MCSGYKVSTDNETFHFPTKEKNCDFVNENADGRIPEPLLSSTDYSHLFTTNQTFQSREFGITWVWTLGIRHNMKITVHCAYTSAEGRLGKAYLYCERHWKLDKQSQCPFAIECYEVSLGAWRLTVVSGLHNHQLERHTRKKCELTKDILEPVQTKGRTRCKPKQKKAPKGFECRGVMQQFRTHLAKSKYFERHRVSSENPDVLSELVFAHPESLNLLRAFPYVLIMEATQRMSWHEVPVFQVMGITSEGNSFTAACALMSGKTENNYLWVLNQVQEMLLFVGKLPTTIVTEMMNMDLPLLNAVDTVFPHTKHILCRSHIYENVKYRCFRGTSSDRNQPKDTAKMFVVGCKSVFEAKTEGAYETQLALLESEWRNQPDLIEHVKQTWLNLYKERIVSAWTDNATHFDTNIINDAPTIFMNVSAHSSLKRFLATFDGGFKTLLTELHSVFELQISEIIPSLKSARKICPVVVTKIEIFNMLEGCLSHKALEILVEEYEHATRGVNLESCDCSLRVTHGLPCRHIIAKYVGEGRLIEPDMIHEFWRTLDFGEVDVAADGQQYEEQILKFFIGQFPHLSDGARARITEFMYEASVNPEILMLPKPRKPYMKRKMSWRDYTEEMSSSDSLSS